MSAKRLILFILLFNSTFAFSQNINENSILYGIGCSYNFQTEGYAAELKARIPIKYKLFVTPRISYFVPINKIHEIYLGADISYNMFHFRNLSQYIFAGAYYNNWLNSSEFKSKKAKSNNIAPEVGAGIVLNFRCFYPYIEGRYDAKWQEGSFVLGVMLQFGECFTTKKKVEKKCSEFK